MFFLVLFSVESLVMTGTGTVTMVDATVNNQTGNQHIQRTNQVQQFNSFQADVKAGNTSNPLKLLFSKTLVINNTEVNGLEINRQRVFFSCNLKIFLS